MRIWYAYSGRDTPQSRRALASVVRNDFTDGEGGSFESSLAAKHRHVVIRKIARMSGKSSYGVDGLLRQR
jgi:hypothetical protein